jgi:transcriptional regulator with XRE-family HTH domain
MNTYRNDLLRAEKGRRQWTNERIAEEAGVSVPTVRSVLNGDSRVIFESIEKVAEALGISMRELFTPMAEPEAETLTA